MIFGFSIDLQKLVFQCQYIAISLLNCKEYLSLNCRLPRGQHCLCDEIGARLSEPQRVERGREPGGFVSRGCRQSAAAGASHTATLRKIIVQLPFAARKAPFATVYNWR